MKTEIKADDVIFNFFKQICDEKDDVKCVELGKSWINAMEINLNNMESNLPDTDRIKHKKDIQSNKEHLNSLKICYLKNRCQEFQYRFPKLNCFGLIKPTLKKNNFVLKNSKPIPNIRRVYALKSDKNSQN